MATIRLLPESDYCYCGRLHTQILDHILQPMAFGLCLLQQNLRAVLSPDESGFGDEASVRRCCAFPGGDGISFSLLRAEAFGILKPCDSIAERTFPVFVDLPDIRDTRSFSQGFGSPGVQTRRSE